ncbi:PREDICTED: pentatricopeptide [Prunus dulcis]|uniref:PREDICTED: pentatricopeptide n=1 Tax=Prunus dulcis TaxID=3755 RepID=A0A5E4FHL5_PRUDU|nr:pentatricopeptide repeat-containing protein PNM1, mitochondrial [Prunus dulcis]VVA27654.1 PREDICTED: pentatricopeptide [Prunus dulcis]
MRPLQPLQLRRLLLRYLSTSSSSPYSSPTIQTHILFHSRKPTHFHYAQPAITTTASSHFLSLLHFSVSKPFSSSTLPAQDSDQSQLAQSLSSELLIDPSSDPLSVTQRLQLSFSHITPTPSLVQSVLNLSPDAGRAVIGFNDWLISNPTFEHTDETLSYFVDYFGRRKDFKATHDVIVSAGGVAGPKTFASSIDRLVRAGRPAQAVSFFERMEKDYGLKRDKTSLRLVVEKLCENGFASNAEKMVKSLANEFFPDEYICDLLIKGWCIDGKLEEARRLAGEMYRGGFEIGTTAYNAILDCVSKLCRKKDPFRLHSEAEQILVDMDTHGVPRNVETFNVLISNLCKLRKTEDALNLFHRMGEWGCYPNETTFLVLIRSLYQGARIGEGDEMIDRMKSAGFGGALDKKAYYGFMKILCGIERIDHAMRVFKKMKEDGCEPGIKSYDLLMGKLYAHNRADRATALFNEAQKRGVPLTQKAYQVDPRFLKKKPKAAKKEKKRETFPEKMARKKRRLKQIRLSFVKKPKKMMRRAY